MINWGILGGGKIARRFAASLAHEPESRLYAVSCRSQEKADAFALSYPVVRSYGSHEALLEDARVDAVYLALPHGLHHEWTIRALNNGRSVLCEKPAALNAGQVQDIARTANARGLLFMEAMKIRFVPLYAVLKQALSEGCIGELLSVEASLCSKVSREPFGQTYHTQPIQGGCLLDGGIYCASWLEDLLDGPISVTESDCTLHNAIDYHARAKLRVGGRSAILECAFDRPSARQAVLTGTSGKIVVDELHRPRSMTIFSEKEGEKTVYIPYETDDFYGEIHHFVQCLLEGRKESPIMPLSASVRCALILDRIREHMLPG